MERQRHIDRNAQPRGVGHPLRTARKGIDPMRTRHVVVLVVVRPAFRSIDFLAEPGPLEPVARPLAETGIAARLLGIGPAPDTQRVAHRAGHVAVAAADLHGIGRHDAPRLARTVRKSDDGLFAGVEEEPSEIDPRAAAHRLIHGELRVAPEVMHRIFRIIGAFRKRLITHIHGVFAPLGNIGAPHGAARRLAPYAPRPARRAVAEGVLARPIDLPQVGEARAARPPDARFGVLSGGIVIGEHLVQLHVALARQHDARPGVFEHRHEVRQNVSLRIKVLAGLPQLRTLPFPEVLRLVEIASVALPQGDMPACKPLPGPHGGRKPLDQRPRGTVGEGNEPPPGDEPAHLIGVAVSHRNQFGDLAAVGIEFDPRSAVFAGQQRPDRIAHGPGVPFAKGVIGKSDRGIDTHPAAGGIHALHLHVAARHFAGDDARKRAADGPPHGHADPLGGSGRNTA